MGTYLDYLAESNLCALLWPSTSEHENSDLIGWRLMAAVLLITIVRSGLTYSFGVFVVELNKEFHRPMTEQSIINSDIILLLSYSSKNIS